MNSLQILSFVGFTLLVAVITWWKVRKTDTGSQQGYFLAGRSLKAPVIAASLMLTNLSTEQLVGLSGQAYKSGMSVMGWKVTSAVTLIFLALIFLPRYLKRGIATIPIFWRNVMIKRRVLSSTSASSLPPASAFCRLFSIPARWRSTACFMWVSRYNFPMVRLSGYWLFCLVWREFCMR